MDVLSDSDKKDVTVESIAQKALKDEKALSELFQRILSKDDAIRFSSFKVLLLLSEKHPGALYDKWGFFADLLDSDNSYLQYIAMYIMANLTKADTQNRFEKIFNKYYSILDDDSTITAAHLASNSGKIAKAKPGLQGKITAKLLNIDRNHRGKQKDLIKGYAIEALSEYFEEAENRNEILEFVKAQLVSKSPKTRKIAKEFLRKWAKSANST
jgi:hypothetical protein